MSWLIAVVGRAGKLGAKLQEEATRYKCAEPEETIKAQVVAALVTAAGSFPPDYAVSISASGSQSAVDYRDPSKGLTNQLRVEVNPLWLFVE